jgi:hypothetical protein
MWVLKLPFEEQWKIVQPTVVSCLLSLCQTLAWPVPHLPRATSRVTVQEEVLVGLSILSCVEIIPIHPDVIISSVFF